MKYKQFIFYQSFLCCYSYEPIAYRYHFWTPSAEDPSSFKRAFPVSSINLFHKPIVDFLVFNFVFFCENFDLWSATARAVFQSGGCSSHPRVGNLVTNRYKGLNRLTIRKTRELRPDNQEKMRFRPGVVFSRFSSPSSAVFREVSQFSPLNPWETIMRVRRFWFWSAGSIGWVVGAVWMSENYVLFHHFYSFSALAPRFPVRLTDLGFAYRRGGDGQSIGIGLGSCN